MCLAVHVIHSVLGFFQEKFEVNEQGERWGVSWWNHSSLSQDSSSGDNRGSLSLYLFILITFLFLLLKAASFVPNLKASHPRLITVLLIDKSRGQEKKESCLLHILFDTI